MIVKIDFLGWLPI